MTPQDIFTTGVTGITGTADEFSDARESENLIEVTLLAGGGGTGTGFLRAPCDPPVKVFSVAASSRETRNRERFKLAILFHCGGLDLEPRTSSISPHYPLKS